MSDPGDYAQQYEDYPDDDCQEQTYQDYAEYADWDNEQYLEDMFDPTQP